MQIPVGDTKPVTFLGEEARAAAKSGKRRRDDALGESGTRPIPLTIVLSRIGVTTVE
jgi:hypothetical protein